MFIKAVLFSAVVLLGACNSGDNMPVTQMDDDTRMSDDSQTDEGTQKEDTETDKGSQLDPVLGNNLGDTEYLVANALRSQVITTESGLQYEVLKSAEGAKPSKNSHVTVHYVGNSVDGTEFDSSYSRNNQPSTFPLSRVIAGWTEGVQLMSVGSKYRFVIPANLAYGNRGSGTTIKPGATLIFEVDLLEINSI